MADYTMAQRNAFYPPACPRCGSKRITVEWDEVSSSARPHRFWTPRMTCADCQALVPDS